MANSMTTIVSALVDKTARAAVEALHKEGFGEQQVQLLDGGAERARKALRESGFDKDELDGLVEAFDDGKVLVTVHVEESKADKADSILQRFEAKQNESGKSVPVVEEELEISKRKGGAQGVRVNSRLKEKPVEANVKLRDEHVEVQSRDVDRELSPEEAESAFTEKTVEVTGIREEVQVEKRARVTGEVEVSKETGQREETVRDTVRATDVEVEKVGTASDRR